MLMNVSSLFGKESFMKDTEKAAKKFVCNLPYQKSTHAFILSYPLSFVNGKSGAARYVKYVNFYSTEPQGKLNRDTFIDLVVFPVVDNVVGRGMAPLKGMLYVRGARQLESPHATKLLADNAQLMTSAAITRAINLSVEKGPTNINKDDVKQFAQCCFIQMTCDAVDEGLIKPLVQMTAGDDSEWIGLATHTGLKIVFHSLFTGMVVKNKTAQ